MFRKEFVANCVPMKVNNNMLLKLEDLSRISLSEEQRESMLPELQQMIDMVTALKEIDLSGLPDSGPGDEKTISLRSDSPVAPLDQEAVIQLRKSADNPFFKVPNVMHHQLKNPEE